MESNIKGKIAFISGASSGIGKATAEKLSIPVTVVETLEEAVPKAYAASREGEIVLLSPACASWDQFANFEVRGDCFIEAVEKL